jgi:hypothetical protein
MIDATVVNSDPAPSPAEPGSPRSASPPIRSKAASYGPRGVSSEPRGVSPLRGAAPEGPSPGGVELVPGGDGGVGSGSGEGVCVDDGAGSGLGDGDGSGVGSDDGEGEGSGVGDGVGEGFFAVSAATAPIDTALSVQAIAQTATRLAA